MGSLSKCLSKMARLKDEKMHFSPEEASIIRGMADAYIADDGIDAQKAAVQAVEDYIEQLEEERADIVKQVEDQGGEVPKVVEPEKRPEPDTPEQIYDAAKAVWLDASRAHTEVTKAFRARTINEDAFIKSRKDFEQAQATFDVAETAFIDAKNKNPEPAKPKEPEAAKPAEAKPVEKPNESDALFSRNTPFYSALSRAVDGLNVNTASADGWKAQVKGLVNKGIAKQAEVEAVGLNEWLDLQTGKVTKDQVAGFLKQNGVTVEETELGIEAETKRQVTYAEAREILDDDPEAFIELAGGGRIHADRLHLIDKTEPLFLVRGGKASPEPKFESYQLPGGKNYRELLLRLPSHDAVREKRLDTINDEFNRVLNGRSIDEISPTERATIERLRAEHDVVADGPGQDDFRSSHFQQPNILAHIRFNERTDADGKRVLFIEEIQSDWAQKGKKEGFSDKREATKIIAALGGSDAAMVKASALEAAFTERTGKPAFVNGRGDEFVGPEADEWNRIIGALEVMNGTAGQGHIPSAPFVQKTEAWVGLALKRMIRYAAENGFDKVAFINGEQSADRYDLSKQIKEVQWVKRRGKTDGNIRAFDHQGNNVIDEKIDESKLADYVGKDVAQRLIEEKPVVGTGAEIRTLSGLDLKVGGEGMKAFYDKIVPNVANDILKKLGGGRVGEVRVPLPNPDNANLPRTFDPATATIMERGDVFQVWADGKLQGKGNYDTREAAEAFIATGGKPQDNTQPGFDITPAMRDAAMGGQPLFKKGEPTRGITRDTFINETVKAFGNGSERMVGDIVVPIATQAEIQERLPHVWKSIKEGDRVNGFYDPKTGKAYVVLENLSVGQVRGTILHEIGVHFGMEGMLGEKAYAAVLKQMDVMLKAGNKAVIDAHAQAVKNAAFPNQVAEETLAYMVTNSPELPFIARIISAIKTFLFRKLGILANKLTPDDMATLAKSSVQHASETIRQGEPLFMTAYHGSPHDFDKFSTDHMGKGEGAQAYGWGMYFAGKKEVAEHYKRALSGSAAETYLYDGQKVLPVSLDAVQRAKYQLSRASLAKNRTGNNSPMEQAVHEMQKLRSMSAARDPRQADWYSEVIAEIKKLDPALVGYENKPRGKLYQVELAPKDEEYLDWDKPLKEQSEHVQQALKPYLDANPSMAERVLSGRTNGRDIYEHMRSKLVYGTYADNGWTSVVNTMNDNAGSQQLTSLALAELGIPGIRYLDGSSRNLNKADIYAEKAGEWKIAGHPGTYATHEAAEAALKNLSHHNYVIFDDKHVEIQAKFMRNSPEMDDLALAEGQVRGTQIDVDNAKRELDRLKYWQRENKQYKRAETRDKIGVADRELERAQVAHEKAVAKRDKAQAKLDALPALDDPRNQQALFARNLITTPAEPPAWVKDQPTDMQESLRKAGAWRPAQSIQDRVVSWTNGWQQKLKQGMVDQFDPIKSLDYHAYMLARMSKSSAGPLESVLFNGTVFLDKDGAVDINHEKGGFIGRMQNLKGEHDRFFAWVIGNRAERLMAEGREHNFTKEDIARLKTLNQGKTEDGQTRSTLYLAALVDLNRYNKSILDLAEKAGLVDGESRPFYEKDFYIPFYRLAEGDQTKGPVRSGGLVRQYAFKTLKGGSEAIGDPMENILKNWAHLIDASMKNQAAVASLEAAAKVGVAHETSADEKGAVFVMKDGAKVYYGVDDPFVLDAINSLSFSGFSGPAMKAMSNVKRWLTYGVTISPTFRIRNVIRDSLAMIGANPASYNVLENITTGWKLTHEDDPAYARMIAGGGVMRFGTFTEGDSANSVKRLIAAGVDKSTILDNPANVKAMLKHAYDWWMHVGDRSENINRAALYQKLRDEGRSHLEASYAARDTMDFSMMGTWSAIRFLAQTVPFFNARLQGLYKLGRGAAEDPRRFAYVAGATALASIALMMGYKDDDDWKQREDFDRETYWWFKIGDKAFRIPKPFELGAIGTVAERGLEAMISDDFSGKQFAQRLGAIVGQQLSMNPVPQLFMPLIEAWANRDAFTGRAIETMGMERLSPSERIGPQTSAFAQLAGKNGVVSPVQIDHLVNGYLGWLGMHLVATADLALRPAMDLPGKPAMRIDDMFVIGDFARDLPAYQSKYVTRLYDNGKEVQEAMADLRAYQKIGATEKAAEILKDKGDKIRLFKLYTHAEQQLTKINQEIKMVQSRGSDPDVKRERLNTLYAQRDRVAKVTEEHAQASRP